MENNKLKITSNDKNNNIKFQIKMIKVMLKELKDFFFDFLSIVFTLLHIFNQII